jgi:putative transposase
MPLREVCVEEQREAMVLEGLAGRRTKAAIASQFGVTRKTVYKWMERYQARGREGLSDLSRAPQHLARAISEPVAVELVRLRLEQPLEGPLKLQAKLKQLHPGWEIPAPSTIGELLKRHGLVKSRARRRRWPHGLAELTAAQAPNDVWATDFKGWFRTLDGQRCDPLTITDLCSRYLLRCQRVEAQDMRSCEPIFEATFKEYGMPGVIRSDNGAPFASNGIAGLTRMSVKWVKAGIKLERIEPGHPEQNGSHERMHKTLKAHTSKPAAATLAAQQQRFDCFRDYFNNARPHQALAQTTPTQHYQPSARPWPTHLEDPWYDADHEVRRVRSNGEIKWKGERIFIGESLIGELLGILQTYWGDWLVSFADLPLTLIDYSTFKLKAPTPSIITALALGALGAGEYPLPQTPNP